MDFSNCDNKVGFPKYHPNVHMINLASGFPQNLSQD